MTTIGLPGSDRPEDRRREGGFTILELLISTVILVSVIAMATGMIFQGQKLLSTASIRSQAEVQAAQIAMQVAERMRNGVLSTLEDGAGNPLADGTTVTSGVRVREYLRWEGGPILGKTQGVVVTAAESDSADGIDNNGNNVTDEFSVHAIEWPLAVSGPATDLGSIGEKIRSIDVARSGKQLLIDVYVLRYDPNIREERAYRGTASVTLKN